VTKIKRVRPEVAPFRVYLIVMEFGGVIAHKVGISRNPDRRARDIKTHCPGDVTLVCDVTVSRPVGVEKMLHGLYRAHHVGREWFVLSPEQVERFRKTCYEADEMAEGWR